MKDTGHRDTGHRDTGHVQVGEPFLRAFHWLLVLGVVGGWLLGKFGPLQMTLHFWAGYLVAALLVFRLVWGFIGPATARFSQFLRGPRATLAYIRSLPARSPSRSYGHNPLGAWSVLALLGTLAAQVATGLIADPDDYINVGPLAGMVSSEWNRWALGMHHKLGWVLLALVALHLGAIVFYRAWKREDLVTPMITGRHR